MNTIDYLSTLSFSIVVEQLGWMILHSLWQFFAIGVITFLMLRCLRRNAATLRYGVLVSAMIVAVLCPVVTWVMLSDQAHRPLSQDQGPYAMKRRNDPVPTAFEKASGMVIQRADAKAGPIVLPDAGEQPGVGQTQATTALPVRIEETLRPWLAWIVAAWSIGVVFCAMRPMLGWLSIRKLRRVGTSPVSAELQDAMCGLSKRLGVRRIVQLYQSTLVQVPVVVGYVRPMILLPVSLIGHVPIAQLEAILLHELVHIRRHDFLVNLFQTLIETLFFYHPAMWWLSHRIRIEREHCCDDAVVQTLGNRVEYGRALVAIEQMRGASGVLALGVSDGSLLARIRRIASVHLNDTETNRWSPLSLIASGLLVACMFSWMAWSSWAQDPVDKPVENPNGSLTNNIPENTDSERIDVFGLDISRLPRTTDERATKGLTYEDPVGSGMFRDFEDVCFMPLNGPAVHYRPSADLFYITLTDKATNTYVWYGPIQGNPIEVLKLEPWLLRSMRDFSSAGNPGITLRSMALSSDTALAAKGLDLMREVLLDDVAWESIDSHGEFAMQAEINLDMVIEFLQKHSDRLRASKINGLEELEQAVQAMESRFAAALPDAKSFAYNEAGYLQKDLPSDNEIGWGNPTNGMRLGLLMDRGIGLSEGSEPVPLRVFVQNSGQEQLRFHVDGYICEWINVKVKGPNGSELRTEFAGIPTDIPSFPIAWKLEPGEKLELGQCQLSAASPASEVLASDIRGFRNVHQRVRANSGTYKAELKLPLNTRRTVRAKGEWFGNLSSAVFPIAIQTSGDVVLSENKSAEPKQAETNGTLRGRFVFDGDPPTPADFFPKKESIDPTKPQKPGPDGRFSGVEGLYRLFREKNIAPNTLNQSLLVNKDGGVANVYVWAISKNIPWTDSPASLSAAKIEFRNGQLVDRCSFIVAGQTLHLENNDPVDHSLQADFMKSLNSSYNTLIKANSRDTSTWNLRAVESFPTRLNLGLAPWASGVLLVHQNPYVAISDRDGTFELKGLPPGEWEFRAWHERAGYIRFWPKGQFKTTIGSGDNSIGEIRLKPEMLGIKEPIVESVPKLPANREQVGEVQGKPVYRDELTDDNLNAFFSGPAWKKYKEIHQEALTPTDQEIEFAAKYFNDDKLKRLQAEGGEEKIRKQLSEIETKLLNKELSDDATDKLELEHRVLRHQLEPPPPHFANFILENWKLQKHLYDEFGGGRILWQQAGLEAFDATRAWLETQEKNGEFKITDLTLRSKFYGYWNRNHGAFLTDDKERIRNEFLSPPWVAKPRSGK